MISPRYAILLLFTAILCCSVLPGQARSQQQSGDQAVSDPWPARDVMKPAALNTAIAGKKKGIVVIHTGPKQLYEVEHIPGAVEVGQVGSPEGVKALKEKLQTTSKNKEIVLYCGCCPWVHCPNIRPAYTLAKEMGFKNVKVLDIPSTFKLDWVNKGYVVEKELSR